MTVPKEVEGIKLALPKPANRCIKEGATKNKNASWFTRVKSKIFAGSGSVKKDSAAVVHPSISPDVKPMKGCTDDYEAPSKRHVTPQYQKNMIVGDDEISQQAVEKL